TQMKQNAVVVANPPAAAFVAGNVNVAHVVQNVAGAAAGDNNAAFIDSSVFDADGAVEIDDDSAAGGDSAGAVNGLVAGFVADNNAGAVDAPVVTTETVYAMVYATITVTA
ncbi:hypothetical protein HDU76_006550, partial [Blyttiomyces sp. JEL0837]